MHKEKELAHYLCETNRHSLVTLAAKTVPGSFLVGSYVLQKGDLVPFNDPYAPLIIFVNNEELALKLTIAFRNKHFTCEKHAKGTVLSTTVSIEDMELFPLYIISCQQPPDDLVFLRGGELSKNTPLASDRIYWQTKEGYPLCRDYLISNDYGPQFRRDMRACLLHVLPFLDEESKKHVSFTADGTYYNHEKLLRLKEKELFLDAVVIEFSCTPLETQEAIKEGLKVIMTSMVAGTHLLTRLHPELSTEECIKQAVNYLNCLRMPDEQTMQGLITPDMEKILRDGNFSLAQMSELLSGSAVKEYYAVKHKSQVIAHVKHVPSENWQEKVKETYKEIRLCILDADQIQTRSFGNKHSYQAKVKAIPCTKQDYEAAPLKVTFLDLHKYLKTYFAHLVCYAVCTRNSTNKQYVYSTWAELNTKLDPYGYTTITSIDENKTLVGSVVDVYKHLVKAEVCAKPEGHVFSSLNKLFEFYHQQ